MSPARCSSSGAPARMFLVELMKGRAGELRVEPPLMVRGDDGGYSEEKLRIYRGGARKSAAKTA